MSVRVARQSKRRIFAIPALLAFASLAGLLLGLTGDGAPDVAAWALLALPILAILCWPARALSFDNRKRT